MGFLIFVAVLSVVVYVLGELLEAFAQSRSSGTMERTPLPWRLFWAVVIAFVLAVLWTGIVAVVGSIF